jgi:adenine-specific DNA-methyltransferase
MANKTLTTDELPSIFSDRLGLVYTSQVSSGHKKKLGQYFTPVEIAKLMAQFCTVDREKIKILDPGCGVGILSCALAEYISLNNPNVREIEITAFETDLDIIAYAERSFSHLGEWLRKRGVLLTHFVCINDFIHHNALVLENQTGTGQEELFDVMICNPPYFKIAKDDPINVAARSIIHGQTNIYCIFLMLGAKLLKEHGQCIFITPRSFASGSYFRLFRELFFSMMEFQHIHLFDSRRDAFQRDKVLQENIIVSCIKNQQMANQLPLPFDERRQVSISVSNGLHDIASRKVKDYALNDLVDLKSEQRILYIPTSANDDQVISLFKSWKSRLKDFKINVSTGKVVAHRSSEWISIGAAKDTVPLIWLNNVDKMKFHWPIEVGSKGKEKWQHMVSSKASASVLIPNKDYIFLRRFSSKDDHSKLIATPYFSKDLKNYRMIGVENHLNVIYHTEKAMLKSEVIGLSALLNSKLFDVYFRTFNGNINVSATELKEITFPDVATIRKIGNMIDMNNYTQDYLDQIIGDFFKIDLRNLQLWMN